MKIADLLYDKLAASCQADIGIMVLTYPIIWMSSFLKEMRIKIKPWFHWNSKCPISNSIFYWLLMTFRKIPIFSSINILLLKRKYTPWLHVHSVLTPYQEWLWQKIFSHIFGLHSSKDSRVKVMAWQPPYRPRHVKNFSLT